MTQHPPNSHSPPEWRVFCQHPDLFVIRVKIRGQWIKNDVKKKLQVIEFCVISSLVSNITWWTQWYTLLLTHLRLGFLSSFHELWPIHRLTKLFTILDLLRESAQWAIQKVQIAMNSRQRSFSFTYNSETSKILNTVEIFHKIRSLITIIGLWYLALVLIKQPRG